MKKGLLSLLIVLCLLAVVGCGFFTKSDAPENAKTVEAPRHVDISKLPNIYEDKEYGFSFRYPKNWELIDDPKVNVILVAPLERNNTARMNIALVSADPELLRSSKEKIELEFKSMFKNFNLISAEKEKFAGEDCWIITFTSTERTINSLKKIYLFNHGKNLYSIVFISSEIDFAEYYDDIFKDIASTFVFK